MLRSLRNTLAYGCEVSTPLRLPPPCGEGIRIWQKNFVVPDKRSEAERRSGTHNHRI